jgi:lysozyme family protein
MAHELIQAALAFTLPFEGGFVDDPDDHGGATNMGITLRTLKDASARVHGHAFDKDLDGDIDVDDLKLMSTEEVEEVILVEGFWPDTLDVIDRTLAIKTFDFGFNMGIRSGGKLLQTAVNNLAGRSLLAIDGVLGSASAIAINSLDSGKLVSTLIQVAISHYNAIVLRDPTQSKFLKGWIRRANALPVTR